MKNTLFIGFSVAIVVGLSAAGQNPPPPTAPPPSQTPAAQAPPVFRAGTDLVHLDVSVLDKSRRPVRGLSVGDFTLLEDGKPQTVTAFSAVDLPAAVAPPVPWMRDVPPDVRSNDMSDSRLFVVVLDDALIPGDADMTKRAKQIVHDFVDRLGPTDLAAIILTGDNRNPQDFTSDHSRLLAVLDKFSPGLAQYDFGFSGGAAAAGIAGGLGGDENFYEQTIDTLQNVADFLVQVPQHRKALVWISPGVPVDHAATAPLRSGGGEAGPAMAGKEAMQRIIDEIPEILQRAQRANVAVYAIDPSGPGGMERYILSRLAGKNLQGQDPTALAHSKATLQLDNVETIAAGTGGNAIVNTNDFAAALTEVFQETSSYYLLGFQPANTKADGKLRRVEVKVNRPDVEVRTRSGYFAPEAVKVVEAAKAAAASPLATAMASILPNPDMPMQVTAAPFLLMAAPVDPKAKNARNDKNNKSNARPPTSTVAVVLGVRQKAREDSATARVVEDVDLLTSAFTPEGTSRGTSRQTAHIALREGATGEFNYEVVTHIDLAPGRYELRLATYSGSLEKTGSVFTDVIVPDFANAPVSLSGVVINKTPAVASGPKNALPGLLPFAPTTVRDFIATDTASAFLRVYEGGKTKLAAVPLTVRLVDNRDKAVVEKTETIDAAKFSEATRGADYTFPLPIDRLERGPYLLTFAATLGKDTVKRDVRFTVR